MDVLGPTPLLSVGRYLEPPMYIFCMEGERERERERGGEGEKGRRGEGKKERGKRGVGEKGRRREGERERFQLSEALPMYIPVKGS